MALFKSPSTSIIIMILSDKLSKKTHFFFCTHRGLSHNKRECRYLASYSSGLNRGKGGIFYTSA